MKKILWLASWYPNKLFPFEGDFIQRHAKAVALYQAITVIYVVKDGEGIFTNDTLTEIFEGDQLKEIIIYYKPFITGIALLNKLLSHARYVSIYKKAISKYIEQEGAPDLVHVHVPVKAGILARWNKKKKGIPFIVSEHLCAYNKLNPQNFFARNWWFQNVTRRIFRSADMVLTVCEANRKELTNIFGIKKSMVVCNVADNRLFHYQDQFFQNPFIFIHVSSFTYQKNVYGILHAFMTLKKKIQNWRCVMVGPINPELVKLAGESGLNAFIEWTGEISYEQVAANLKKAHCMVMFSRYENSPCAIIEALSAGVPVIASSVGGIPEVIDTNNGSLVEPGDVSGLALAMQEMIKEYGTYQRKAIGTKAKAMFSFETVGAQIAAVYNELLTKNKSFF